eukprot:CAMPEP_0119113084 /NCGR_PEP_ID=MMETSP1180-20130426/42764_1 /TAXON_ID=3052 ORGANISM="Chlamydomonas cf sp, Strain CCMP681" /NCGR_SAMPLE_ID=MMETSP1180 /ASSEMBLY_ACC=CAM_ASM_000741 /LENGTH=59 /DNA_ID=CAMNT_0007100935 /DNA_START=150 /DNA_END=326 /DNA_ORIENTATION=-
MPHGLSIDKRLKPRPHDLFEMASADGEEGHRPHCDHVGCPPCCGQQCALAKVLTWSQSQ